MDRNRSSRNPQIRTGCSRVLLHIINIRHCQRNLQGQLLLCRKSQIPFHHDLDIIVKKTDQRMAKSQYESDDDQRCKTIPDNHGHKQPAQHHNAPHGGRTAFFHVTGRAYVTNTLPELQFMKGRNQHRSQRCAYNQGRQQRPYDLHARYIHTVHQTFLIYSGIARASCNFRTTSQTKLTMHFTF